MLFGLPLSQITERVWQASAYSSRKTGSEHMQALFGEMPETGLERIIPVVADEEMKPWAICYLR
jgi:hypothetical protein